MRLWVRVPPWIMFSNVCAPFHKCCRNGIILTWFWLRGQLQYRTALVTTHKPNTCSLLQGCGFSCSQIFFNSMFNLGISNCAKVGLKLRLPILHLKRTIVSRVINTITGHSPFRSHLHKLKLTDEPSCPKCGENSVSESHVILKCPFYRRIRKQILKLPHQDNQNKTCIALTDLVDFC